MDKTTVLKRLRDIRAVVPRGAGHSLLGTLIGEISKIGKGASTEYDTRKQLQQRAIVWLNEHKKRVSLGIRRSHDDQASDLIASFILEQETVIVERDLKKQVSIIIERQMQNVVKLHPEYFTKRGATGVFARSVSKRVVGDVTAYLTRVASRHI